ncbi:serine/threonine protein kinase [Salinibius halmophilus]|uniref:serine/threonine protein kinase n=1 Tax=Salinibius halmophilus TaxID=1853216 RepID=UPI000E67484F|nr:serine/threonine protein kinase [Salinibius halmophilus]
MMTADFNTLTPDTVLDAIESLGLYCTGQVQALNSFENRVFLIGIDQAPSVIAKFYRPNRWSDAQIIEEHSFTQALADADIFVAPAQSHQGATLHHFQEHRFSLFPRLVGRPAEFTNPDQLFDLGEALAQLHLVGGDQAFNHRPALTLTSFFQQPAEVLLNFVGNGQRQPLAEVFKKLEQPLEALNNGYEQLNKIRLHGDCHTGNILYDQAPLFVDFDDARMAPAIQDIWMLLSGEQVEQQQQLSEIIEGYEQVADFDRRQLNYIEFLRTLRIVQQAAWRAQRWSDPAFPQAFPWFNTEQYWLDLTKQLNQQLQLVQG